MRTLALWLAVSVPVCADIVALKDGSIIECKIVKDQIIKNNQAYVLVEDEKKAQREIPLDQIGSIYKGETSWEARERNLKWYADQKDSVKETWPAQASFAKQCKQRKLDDQYLAHSKKAYELRKAEAKDDMNAHDAMARWLERDLQLYEEAANEYRIVYACKKERAADKSGEHLNLGRWCETKSLYDEAEIEYNEALKLDPKNTAAVKGLERLRMIRDVLVNPAIFRTVKEQAQTAAGSFRAKQAADGSYGEDLPYWGQHALRAMTAINAMALLSAWEFETVEKPQAKGVVPKEVEKALEYLLASDAERKAYKGHDVWGNVWSVGFLTRCYRRQEFKSKKDVIKAKIDACLAALARQAKPEGGWAYYHFVAGGNSFVTQAVINFMLDAKEAELAIPEPMLQRAVQNLRQQKQSPGIFMYSNTAKQKVEGSAFRSPGCELALARASQGNAQDLALAVDNFFKYRHIGEKIKGKSGTHMGTGGTAPYYYLYNHYWCARAIKELDKSRQSAYLSKLRDVFLADQEGDGGFSDWGGAKSNKLYGTGLGTLTIYEMGTLPRGTTTR